MPLWIKVYREDEQTILLTISRRFRKKKVIKKSRSDEPFLPFIHSETSSYLFNENTERKAALRILLLSRIQNERVSSIFQGKVGLDEIIESFKKHFERARFYPPSYNDSKEGELAYSKFVIDKISKKEGYRIFMNEDFDKTILSSHDLSEIVDFYLKEELNWNLFGLKVKH